MWCKEGTQQHWRSCGWPSPMEATPSLTTFLSVPCLVSSEASNFHPRLSPSLLYFPKKFAPEFSLIPSLGERKMGSSQTQDSWEPQSGGRQRGALAFVPALCILSDPNLVAQWPLPGTPERHKGSATSPTGRLTAQSSWLDVFLLHPTALADGDSVASLQSPLNPHIAFSFVPSPFCVLIVTN